MAKFLPKEKSRVHDPGERKALWPALPGRIGTRDTGLIGTLAKAANVAVVTWVQATAQHTNTSNKKTDSRLLMVSSRCCGACPRIEDASGADHNHLTIEMLLQRKT